jgi:hypothetical protein
LPLFESGISGATDVAALEDSDGGTTLDDMRTPGGGSSSPDAPDESLRNCLRFISFGGGGIETAVETVGFEGASPVGVLARGIN